MTLAERREARATLIDEIAGQIREAMEASSAPMDLPSIELDVRVSRRKQGLPWKNLSTFDFRDALRMLVEAGVVRILPGRDYELCGAG
jgi:hypothetical protein